MRLHYPQESAIDELVGAIIANEPEEAFSAIDRLFADEKNRADLQQRVAIARARKR